MFVVLLIKTPKHEPSTIPVVNCAIAAGALFAAVGFSHLLGGSVNPAVAMAVIWAQNLQVPHPLRNADHNPTEYFWFYILCPFFGAWLAAKANRLHIDVLSSFTEVDIESDANGSLNSGPVRDFEMEEMAPLR